MALELFMPAVVALALIGFAWSPIAVLVIVALAVLGHFLCQLIGVGGERFFSGSDPHRHP